MVFHVGEDIPYHHTSHGILGANMTKPLGRKLLELLLRLELWSATGELLGRQGKARNAMPGDFLCVFWLGTWLQKVGCKEWGFVIFSVMSSQTSRWWFQTFVVFTPTSGGVPFWLIFLRWVETTNQRTFLFSLVFWHWIFVDPCNMSPPYIHHERCWNLILQCSWTPKQSHAFIRKTNRNINKWWQNDINIGISSTVTGGYIYIYLYIIKYILQYGWSSIHPRLGGNKLF